MNHNLKEEYSIRKLGINDLEDYKALRLEALQKEPSVFSSNYDSEKAFDRTIWAQRLSNPDAASFGLYCGTELIGITGVFIPGPDTDEGLLVASYIRKAYRGKGLSSLLYRCRIDWAIGKGLARLIVSHRKSNEASYAANQRFGFRYTHEEQQLWPDGQTEANVFYCLDL